MSSEIKSMFKINDYLDCFGQFNRSDAICLRRCALRIRCAIEQDQNARYEILEDMAASDYHLIKLQ